MSTITGIKPFTNRALDAMRHSGYPFSYALCELIDNSIWHGQAKNIKIDYTLHNQSSETERLRFDEVFVSDDGIGMDYEILSRAVQIGESTTYGSTENFGRFGYGMIAGAISQCQTVEIYSKTKTNDWNYIYYNISEVANGKDIATPIQKHPPQEYLGNISDSGTIIIWSGFDIAENFDKDWESMNSQGSKKGKLGQLAYQLGRIYRKQIGEEIVTTKDGKTVAIKNPNIRTIELCGRKIEAIDPLYLAKNSITKNDPEPHHIYDELTYEIPVHPDDLERANSDTEKIHIRMTILNEKWREHNEKGNTLDPDEQRKRFINWNENISIVRLGREIDFGNINQLFGIGRTERSDRYWGMEIEFPPSLDRRFTIRNVKVGVKIDQELRDLIYPVITNTLGDARRVISQKMTESKKKAVQAANAGPHTAAQDRFKGTGLTEEPNEEQLPEDKKAEQQQKLYERFAKFDKSVDREKFGEIGVIFQDDPGMGESLPFIDIRSNLGNNIVIYNLSHPFFIHINSIYEKIEELAGLDAVEEVMDAKLTPEQLEYRKTFLKMVGQTRYLVDLLLGSFAVSKGEMKHDQKQEVRSTLNSIISRWTDNLYTVANDKNFAERVG
tara:strand:+ start:1132 stop:2967 length:1836 start_codon:yes stop_codon:yes gene_type:complete